MPVNVSMSGVVVEAQHGAVRIRDVQVDTARSGWYPAVRKPESCATLDKFVEHLMGRRA